MLICLGVQTCMTLAESGTKWDPLMHKMLMKEKKRKEDELLTFTVEHVVISFLKPKNINENSFSPSISVNASYT